MLVLSSLSYCCRSLNGRMYHVKNVQVKWSEVKRIVDAGRKKRKRTP